jgi:cysteinyl-tRNA synthetase
MDFVLWKPSTTAEPGWASPWGRGRPGWHIECSAMAHELLGESFDIHGGGLDLQFPHHENEIAQSACAHPHGQFARYWLHNEMLQVEGKKMSKSLGNFFTVRDLLDGSNGAVKASPLTIRIAFLMSHYRTKMDFSSNRRHEAMIKGWTIERTALYGQNEYGEAASTYQPFPQVVEALCDDLDTRTALDALVELAKQTTSSFTRHDFFRFMSSVKLLGIDLFDAGNRANYLRLDQQSQLFADEAGEEFAALDNISAAIDRARTLKDFRRSDEIRAALKGMGISVMNTDGRTMLVRQPNYDKDKMISLATSICNE